MSDKLQFVACSATMGATEVHDKPKYVGLFKEE